MFKKKSIGLLAATLFIAACNGGGGGGGGGGDEGQDGFGSFHIMPSQDLGTTCMGYVMTSASCSSIGGNWNSSAVAAKYTCSGPVNASTGKCHLDGLKFSAKVSPPSNEAIEKCEALGGTITPTNQTDCEAASGSWLLETPATTAYACSKAPSDASECALVGGSYGSFRLVTGGLNPSIEGIDAGKVLVFLHGSDVSDEISHGTAVTDVSGTLSIIGVTDDLWINAVAPLSRASDFRINKDNYIEFDLNIGKDYSFEDYNNGIQVKLQMYYRD